MTILIILLITFILLSSVTVSHLPLKAVSEGLPPDDEEILKGVDYLFTALNFPKFVFLSSQILQHSEKYRDHLKDYKNLIKVFASNYSINSSPIKRRALKEIAESFSSLPSSTTKSANCSSRYKKDRIFYLKTHKTGSSTFSGIVWRTFCLLNAGNQWREGIKNCFLPSRENPGKTWNVHDLDKILGIKGTSMSGKPFDVWNAHIRIDYFSAGMQQSRDWGETRGNGITPSKSFEKRFFHDVLPYPTFFFSMIRRPAYRFESAFHWYELFDVIHSHDQSQQSSFEEWIQAEKTFPSFLSSSHSVNRKTRKKNRLDPTKLKKLNSSSTSAAAKNLIALIEDIAWTFLQQFSKNIQAVCSLTDTNCMIRFFRKKELARLCKEIIDWILWNFEQRFHYRSGLQAMTKELLGIQTQFPSTAGHRHHQRQEKFERNFVNMLRLLFADGSRSTSSLPCAKPAKRMLILNLDDFSSSLLLLKSFFGFSNNIPLYYLPQKQQQYVKLSALLAPQPSFPGQSTHVLASNYYQFLDLLQYYDLLLFELQKLHTVALLGIQKISDAEIEFFRKETESFHKFCESVSFHSHQLRDRSADVQFIVRRSVSVMNKLLEIKADRHFDSMISPNDRELLCSFYQMDNFDYVQYFHNRADST